MGKILGDEEQRNEDFTHTAKKVPI